MKLKTKEALNTLLEVQTEMLIDGKIERRYLAKNEVHKEYIESCVRRVFENNCEPYLKFIIVEDKND